MKQFFVLSSISGVLLLSGCDMGPKSGYGFTLPDGDVEAGQQVFTAKGCSNCHAIAGFEELRNTTETDFTVTLGGETTHIATYGELVTSVINPSHKLAEGYEAGEISVDGISKMTNYNDVLTVSELIDLIAFLQSQYKLKEYPKTPYPPYSYR